MEDITAYFLNLLSVIEKELALLRAMTGKTFTHLCAIGAGIFLIAAAIGVLAWTCYTGLAILIGPVLAGLVSSLLTFLGGGLLVWSGNKGLK